MCYTKEASIKAFLVGIFSSLLLITFGKEKHKKINLAIGLFFIFVSFMQLLDYLIWIDLDCKKGTNKLAGYLGYLFNYFQPIVMLLLIIYIGNINDNIPKYIKNCNIIYVIIILVIYIKFIFSNKICSKNKNGRVSWSWYINILPILYLIILGINYSYIAKNKMIVISFIISLVFFLISKFNYKNHIGEFWCYFVNSAPVILLAIQKFTNY